MRYDPRNPYPRAYFSASDLASARYGEARYLGEHFVNIYDIASACNEQVCSGEILPELRLEDVPIKEIEKHVPSIRQYKLLSRTLTSGQPLYASLLYQPCLLVEGGKGRELIDGVERLVAAKAAGARSLRCFIIPYEKALKFGRSIIDESPITPAGWPGLQRTMPPRMESETTAPGAVLSRAHREFLAEMELRKHRYQSSLVAFAATAAAAEKGRVVADINVRTTFLGRNVTLHEKDQDDLDVLFRAKPDRFSKRGPAKSLYEVLTILYIKRIIAGILKFDGHAGKAVLVAAGVKRWPGGPPNLESWLKDRSHIEAGACPFFAAPIDDRLLEVGKQWQGAMAQKPIDHCTELARVAFKVHEIVKIQRGNLRRVLEVNTPNARESCHWPIFFQTAVEGKLTEAHTNEYAVDAHQRALLALHGRINPAKIWRDDARNTLLYQWIIALGDLVRTGRMVVTCLMAQELFQVEDIRSVASNPEIAPAWGLFDQILAMATTGKVGSLPPISELNLLCRDAMRDRCAQIISPSDKPGKHFTSRQLPTLRQKIAGSPTQFKKPRRLSPSEIAELPILLT
ncbi:MULTISPECIES: hypothetical protein [Hyphomicrobiales]|jgi:hypothetical protein|uniref:hypothetical protein n=1 Tax=Methylobacterium sp. CCH7-A2 TaxID=1768789 RepID=UPI00083598F3|nr:MULTISPECIES: hypothetical protein [Hyphomicrobiales]